jgi:hypothetical protein
MYYVNGNNNNNNNIIIINIIITAIELLLGDSSPYTSTGELISP